MNQHLSEDQIVRCLAGDADEPSRVHLTKCAWCRGEVERFGSSVSLFRRAIQHQVAQRRVNVRLTPRPATAMVWRWAFIAAAIVVFVLPLLMRPQPQPIDADALMRSVNTHLSRTVPAPLEPLMVEIPADNSITESGGVQ